MIKVLLVDDDEEEFVITKGLLKLIVNTDYHLEWVDNIQQAMEIISDQAHDIYLIDYNLNDGTGLDILAECQNKNFDNPMILLTNMNCVSIDNQAMKYGAADFLPKGELSKTLLDRSIRHALERVKSQQELRHMATHDSLTGLMNRSLFCQLLDMAVAKIKRSGNILAVMFLDLDRFKIINDSLGHNIGDLLLKSVAQRLKYLLRDEDIIARIGGDEFTLIIEGATDKSHIEKVAEKICQKMQQQFSLGGHELYISISIGIATYPEAGINSQDLLKSADTAMYHSKRSGHNSYKHFESYMNTEVTNFLEIEQDFRSAIIKNELRVFYQPQLDIRSNKLIGAEALIRWQHPTKGLLSPQDFLSVAKEARLLVQMGNWVINKVCEDLSHWRKLNLPRLPIAINIASEQIKMQNFVEFLCLSLEKRQITPDYIEIELTEETLINDSEENLDKLQQLKKYGLKLAIDDFGTGYSSLSYLKYFPITTLKIDQCFIQDITTNKTDAAITKSVIEMAHSLDINIIAEGVETEEQLRMLTSFNCDQMQGYLYSKPLSIEDFSRFLQMSNIKDNQKNPETQIMYTCK